MKNQQLQLVTFEQAKRLKEAGFDWECDYFYDGCSLKYAGCEEVGLEKDISPYSNWNHPDLDWNDGVEKPYVSAPTVALALKWVRDMVNIPCSVRFQPNCKYGWEYYLDKSWVFSREDYDDHELAESALLDELLTLIEK